MKKVIIVIFIFFLGCRSEYDKDRIPSVSETRLESVENDLFVASYDLKITTEKDTILFEDYAWLELQWFEPQSAKDSIFVNTNKMQLVFPWKEEITVCFLNNNNGSCSFEIYDKEWNTAGYKGDFFYCTLKNKTIPEHFEFEVYENGKKKRRLHFYKS